jgi:ketosteroid isomerase-like protein
MSRENVEVVRRLMAAIAERDLAGLLALTDPQVKWQSFFALGQGGVYRGHEAMSQYVRDLDEAFEWIRPEVSSMLHVGDLVVGVGQVGYRGRGSGVEAASLAGWVFKFRGGKLLAFRAFSEPQQALEAVGLRE